MKDYTEELKKYWASTDLSFVARLVKSQDASHGYFYNFTDPVSKEKLSYPELENIKLGEKRISFYWAQVKDLVDGGYYKIQLEYTNDPKGKNNPYSLKVKDAPRKLDRLELKEFLVSQGNGQEVNGKQIKYNELGLNNNLTKTIPKEHIKMRFERLNNPDSNKIIANLMREIGKGMYSSKQRMFFELLQNADDSPGKEKVEFHIDIKGDYIFVMHDGSPFSKEDVNAITSAAESTKRNNTKKTGYKGIGFKSVFTDSDEVWLKSGGYQFAFIRNSSLFNDFETFYFQSSDYKEFPKLVEKHRLKYQNEIDTYNSATDIPWQVIPIWQDQLPDEFDASNFNSFNNPVQFALKVGNANIYSEDGYLAAIDNIVKRPQFLLFLRNTSKFRSTKNKVSVTRIDNNQLIEIKKNIVSYDNKNDKTEHSEVFNYIKKTYSDIEVSDKAFASYSIGLKKIIEINELDQKIYHFVDLDGNKIETIPPKLAPSTETEISFGVFISEENIKAENEYLEDLPKYSSLFTYLPMEDTRFQLPFLINADFVPSSDRQKIQGDNLWNKYMMIRVAEMHIHMLNNFATEFQNTKHIYKTYLSLLLKNIVPDDDTAQSIIDAYNLTYLKQLNVKPIVVNDLNALQLISDTIIDNSGLTELFGQEIFYEIISTSKRLPSPELDVSYLINYKYLDVEQINLKELAQNFTPELCEQLGVVIGQVKLYSTPKLLKWLNELVGYLPGLFDKIPFIEYDNMLYSIEALLEENDVWIINKNTEQHEDLFKGLGYYTVNLELEKYANINSFLLGIGGYINDKSLAYQKIESNPKLSSIEVATKLTLIEFFKNAPFMLGIGATKYFEELKLFIDEKGIARPLNNLIDHEGTSQVNSIASFKLNKMEYSSLSEVLRKELIQKNTLFEKFILSPELFNEWVTQFTEDNITEYVNSLEQIFGWIEKDVYILQSQWASIPWLYINDELRFQESIDVCWSEAFDKITHDKYNILKKILSNDELKKVPLYECSRLISLFELKTDNHKIEVWEDIDELDTAQVNLLLDWMETDGSYSDFFNDYTVEKTKEDCWSILKTTQQVYDSSDTALKLYISKIESLDQLFVGLDIDLCSQHRDKIGLLKGDKFLKAIIETGEFDQNLAIYFSQKDKGETFTAFINNLSEFNLETNVEYSANSPEHIILNTILKDVEDIEEIPKEVQDVIDNLLEKIKINSNSLSHYDLSDKIYFGKGDERKSLKLSDILKEFEGESDVLDGLIQSFVGIKDKSKLRKLVFKTRQMSKSQICDKIESEESKFYSEYQIVFQLLYNLNGNDFKWTKINFDTYLEEIGDKKSLYDSYKRFLDIVFEIQLTNLNGFCFLNLELESCVDKNWALESEIIPEWLEEWVDLESNKRIEFISKLGYNGIGSPVVKLRQEAITENFESVNVLHNYQTVKNNIHLSWNTIVWLSRYSSEIVTKNIELINLINNQVSNDDGNNKHFFLPIIENIKENGERVYKLKNLSFENNLLVLNINQELSFEIYQNLSKQDNEVLFIDENCGKLGSYFNLETIKLTTSLDTDVLTKNSIKWDVAFYKKWEYYNQYPIYLYRNGEIPYKQTFNDVVINSFKNDLKVENDGDYYVSSLLSSDVLNNLPVSFPHDKLTNLKEWDYKTLQNSSLLDEDSFDYKESIDRLLQDKLGISDQEQKTENGNAKTHAVYFLDEEGYDVSNATNAGASLKDIIDFDGNNINCIVRSAKGGLLYLDKEHWDMLEDLNTYLVVIYPGNSPRLFKDRLELLQEDLAQNVLFRVNNNELESEINGVFEALKSDAHLILVTSEKMKQELFSKLKNTKINTLESDIAIIVEISVKLTTPFRFKLTTYSA